MAIARPVYAIDKPVTVASFITLSAQLAKVTDGSQLVEYGSKFVVFSDGDRCSCRRCGALLRDVAQLDFFDLPVIMIVCPGCGSKRCPHATDHDDECELEIPPKHQPKGNQP